MRAYLYLGTHQPSWLRTAGVPLFVSHGRLSLIRRTMPAAATVWALDSGGFSELSMYGTWQTTAEDYVSAVVRYDTEIGNLEWAAPQDWMCEPDMVARTGLSIVEHQVRTVCNYLRLHALWADASDVNCPFMPVLQGYSIADYRRCMDMYADAGVDLRSAELVGVGSVCRRQHTAEIREVFETILSIDPELPVHGFGVKSLGLREYGHLLTTAAPLRILRRPDTSPGRARSLRSTPDLGNRWRLKVESLRTRPGGFNAFRDQMIGTSLGERGCLDATFSRRPAPR